MITHDFMSFVDKLSSYYYFCALQQLDFVGCEPFWLAWILSAEVVLVFFFYLLTKKVLRERREWRDYLKKKAEREKIADPETMAKHIWKGE